MQSKKIPLSPASELLRGGAFITVSFCCFFKIKNTADFVRSRRGSAVIFIRLIKNQFFGRQRFLIINVIIAVVIR